MNEVVDPAEVPGMLEMMFGEGAGDVRASIEKAKQRPVSQYAQIVQPRELEGAVINNIKRNLLDRLVAHAHLPPAGRLIAEAWSEEAFREVVIVERSRCMNIVRNVSKTKGYEDSFVLELLERMGLPANESEP